MSIFSEVGRILLEEASEAEASSVPKKPSHTSTHQPKAVIPVTIPPPSFEEEEIYLDGEDMLRVVSISQVKNYTPPKPIIMDEEDISEKEPQMSEEIPTELSDNETELEQELMRAFNETEDATNPSPVSEETVEVTPQTEEVPTQEEEVLPPKEIQKEVEAHPGFSTTSQASLEGDVIFPKGGSFTGTLHGNLSAKETLLLCGEVFGSVEAETLILQGVIHGTLHCQHLTLRNADITSLSKVEGAIRTESLSTEFI